MRIGLVSLHTSPLETPGQGDAGGMNVVVREAALALERAGHEVTIATRASDRQTAGVHALAPHSSVMVHALEAGSPHLDKDELPQVLPEFTRALTQTPGIRDADVLHAHYWLSGLAALDAASDRGAPSVTTLHTVAAQKNAHLAASDDREPEHRLAGERRLAHESLIIAGSKSEMQGIVAGYGDPKTGSCVIHPGVDTEFFRPRAEQPQGDQDLSTTGRTPCELTITVLGRVQPLKGQDLALDAYAEFCGHFPDLAHGSTLTIAGEPTPGAEPFYRDLIARARPFGDRVRFLPAQSREDVARLLRASDLVLIPSHSETFGLVALEAAASGVPVIAFRTTGLVEAVHDGLSGTLLPTRDAPIWAETIARLASDPITLAQQGSSAREIAMGMNWNAHAHALATTYERLIGDVS